MLWFLVVILPQLIALLEAYGEELVHLLAVRAPLNHLVQAGLTNFRRTLRLCLLQVVVRLLLVGYARVPDDAGLITIRGETRTPSARGIGI